MKNIVQRTITGSIYVIFILLAILIDPLGLKILVIILNFIALTEFNRIILKFDIIPVPGWIILNTIATSAELVLIHIGKFQQFGIIPLITFILCILIISLYQKKGNPVHAAASIFYGSLFITLPLVILNLIHTITVREAIPYTLAIFIFIWVNDTFAYLGGISFGRHKLFEKISPKKSWEGFFTGLIAVIPAALLMNRFYPAAGLINWTLIAMLTAVASVFGDFNESLLKRNADIKDSGNLLPGHGGILDRIDSLLFASPVIYIYLLIIYTASS
jgi:phosphatidate cytidylyltransferase